MSLRLTPKDRAALADLGRAVGGALVAVLGPVVAAHGVAGLDATIWHRLADSEAAAVLGWLALFFTPVTRRYGFGSEKADTPT